jgi:putative ABC transport system permease protein
VSGPLPLSLEQLALASVLVLLNGLLSVALGLGVERRLLIAALRTVTQLLLIGFILTPVFAWQHPGPVLALGTVMIALAAREAVRRSSRSYSGVQRDAFVALLLSAGVTALLATGAIIGVEPWWRPQYLIPLVGMMLGNALTGISLGLDRCLTMLDEQRDQVEGRLALGATWQQAARPIAAEAIRAGMIPIINSMSVVGLVTLPGMMTGQILSGTDPALAARYQILIMFLIAAATTLGTTLSVLLGVRAMFDDQHRLRSERLTRRDP